MRDWLAPLSKREAVAEAQAGGLLAGPVNTVADLLKDPPFSRRAASGIPSIIPQPDRCSTPAGRSSSPVRRVANNTVPRCWTNTPASAIRRGPKPISGHPAKPHDAARPLPLPLEGLRVAEITVVWAGPHVTQLLGEWGADIVRIEPLNKPQPYTRGMEGVPTREQTRQLIAQGVPSRLADSDPQLDPWNRNASFNSHARNKRSMTCDIMSPEGHETLLRLVKHCDVLVENNAPQTMDKAGIDWETLRRVNPRLIMLRMPAFALDGPYRNYRAFGLHVEAMIGHTHLRGYPGQPPGLLSESLASDGLAGVQGALTVLMALRHRERTGEGQLIEMPLPEGFLPTLGEFIMDYTMNGPRHAVAGQTGIAGTPPHNVYPCQGRRQLDRRRRGQRCRIRRPVRRSERPASDG